MRNPLIILGKKEIKTYLNSGVYYITAAVFGLFANFLFMKDLFLRDSGSLRPFFEMVMWLLVLFVPAIAMRAFSEEARTNTQEVLLTLPISELNIVLAKLVGVVVFVTLSLLTTLSLPLALFFISEVPIAQTIVAYIGITLCALCFASVGIFCSTLSKSQIVALLLAVCILFFSVVLGTDFFSTLFPKIIQEYTVSFSPFYQLGPFIKGIIDVRALVYFITTSGLFVALSVIQLERRK